MKATIGIIFSAVLLMAQMLLPVAAAGGACSVCDCGMKQCCVKTAVPDSNPAPATTPASGAVKQIQFSATLDRPIVLVPTQDSVTTLSISFFQPSAKTVPLYERNCALVI